MTEQYLFDEYDLIEDVNWLTNVNEIKEFILGDLRQFFQCGQGYYNDNVDLLMKIQDKFYKVNAKAEITSAKQDRGDRLYWAESIESVTWKEVDKPLPKLKTTKSYTFELTTYQEQELDNFIKEQKIKVL